MYAVAINEDDRWTVLEYAYDEEGAREARERLERLWGLGVVVVQWGGQAA